jgi:uncharacterized protein YeeX (DUF496 family)
MMRQFKIMRESIPQSENNLLIQILLTEIVNLSSREIETNKTKIGSLYDYLTYIFHYEPDYTTHTIRQLISNFIGDYQRTPEDYIIPPDIYVKILEEFRLDTRQTSKKKRGITPKLHNKPNYDSAIRRKPSNEPPYSIGTTAYDLYLGGSIHKKSKRKILKQKISKRKKNAKRKTQKKRQ